MKLLGLRTSVGPKGVKKPEDSAELTLLNREPPASKTRSRWESCAAQTLTHRLVVSNDFDLDFGAPGQR